jgi:hypothetical protein
MRRFIKRTKILYDYLLFAWNTEDYDFAYCFAELSWKLNRLADTIATNNHIENAYGKAAEIREVAKMLEVGVDSEHLTSDEQYEHEQKYGTLEMWSPIGQHKKTMPVRMLYTDALNEKSQKEASDAQMKIYDLNEQRYVTTLKKAFKIILKQHRNWWD